MKYIKTMIALICLFDLGNKIIACESMTLSTIAVQRKKMINYELAHKMYREPIEQAVRLFNTQQLQELKDLIIEQMQLGNKVEGDSLEKADSDFFQTQLDWLTSAIPEIKKANEQKLASTVSLQALLPETDPHDPLYAAAVTRLVPKREQCLREEAAARAGAEAEKKEREEFIARSERKETEYRRIERLQAQKRIGIEDDLLRGQQQLDRARVHGSQLVPEEMLEAIEERKSKEAQERAKAEHDAQAAQAAAIAEQSRGCNLF